MRPIVLTALALAAPLTAKVATPARPITDPRSLASPANPAAAPVPLADLGLTRTVGSSAWSADGRQVFLATNLTGRSNIWRTDIQPDGSGSWPVQLIQSDDRQFGLAAAPDGRTLYFLQDKGGDEQNDIYAVPTAGGAVVNLTDTPAIREDNLLFAPDGKAIALSTKLKTEGQENLALLDVASRQVRALTHETDPQWRWSPVAWVDGGRALIANRGFTDSTAGEVYRVDVATGQATRLLGKAGTIYAASDASADGGTIVVTTNEKTGQMHGGLYAPAGGGWRWLTATPWEQNAGEMTPDKSAFLVSTNVDGRTALSLVDAATLKERVLNLPPGVNGTPASPAFTPDGRMLLVGHSGADTPGELATFALTDGRTTAVTRNAMASLSPANLPKSKVVTYRSFDGTLVSAVVTMPFNLKRDGSNPAVVMPHGGPTGQSLDGFNRTATALASRGYVTIQPNPRGSTGYGQAFQKANFQDLGGGDLKDELAAKDFLVASGYVDPKRVGITGGSYGGYMTLMAIGKAPDAFAAAVQLFGIINWRTMWEHEDAGLQAYQRALLGSPDEAPKVYDATSPLTYIRNAKAPLLTLQGENDIRVPKGQAQEVNDILKAKGNVVETVYYPAEGHGFQKRENQLDSLRRTIAWFDKYLKGDK